MPRPARHLAKPVPEVAVRDLRILLLVCDSFGVGEAPDAAAYGDAGSNTIGHVARAAGGLNAPNLGRLGLGCVTEISGVSCDASPGTAHGRLTERSAGKDSTTGHWELTGVVLDRPFPTYPDGFPPEVIEPFERAIGTEVLGNVPASGTAILEELGEAHVRTGRPIVYTSADSVFQIAAHVDVVPLETLYEWCRTARELLQGEHAVGRVIARPFAGQPGSFARTPDRRDLAVPPPQPTVLDFVRKAGVPVYGVGKIADLFSGQGLTESHYSESNDHGLDLTLHFLERPPPSLVFTNLVDFDTKYGHRNDAKGYAECVEALDRRLAQLERPLEGGLLFLTGDHGCDPAMPSTDHSREYTPILVSGAAGVPAVDLGVRSTFADVGATIADLFEVPTEGLAGTSFAEELTSRKHGTGAR
ncbi:MAG TPA: phosphopentomutase [Actinomycetota bacterium]|nr:phosphopentomutase [Actinomycetota bacterium]